MTDRHGYDQAHEYATTAMTQMRQRHVPPTPRNFTVWYEYASGCHPELKRALDILLSNGREFSETLNDEIYEQFFSTAEQDRTVHEVSARIQETLGQVLVWLADAGDNAKDYGEALQSLSGELQGQRSADTLQSLLERILAETQAMASRNSTLEVRLQSSSEQIMELQRNLDDVRREALTDVLTGIANRKFFEMRLKELARDAMECGEPLCLLLADIDHFKQFNDTWGHQFGDQVLKLVARALTDGVKGQDVPARFGGEEFAILLPRTRLSDAVTVADNIRRAVAGRTLIKRATQEAVGRVTLSFGVARFDPGEPIGQFVHRADAALYAAKRQGRNRVVCEDALVPTLEATPIETAAPRLQ